ncbi:MAG: aminotransferase class I/II-fold pyridoxal phosphate-dependent enzyme [Bacteroidota bacterium]
MQNQDTKTASRKLFQKAYDYTRADRVKAQGIYPWFRPIEESEGPVVMMDGKQVVMAGSNNYLGLTAHPRVKEASIKAIEKYGTSCSGSRYLTGTIDLHEELEVKLAKFMGKEAALLFTTGYQSGQGVIQPLMGRGDSLFSDKDNHASIVAGNLMARGQMNVNVFRYKHNDVGHLEKLLKNSDPEAGKLIVTDGVFSTFGNIAHLKEISALAKHHNAQLLVDDAHAFGVIGEGGRGTASEFGLVDEVDLTVCTFSKTLASIGGFVVGEERVINYLKHHSPALIFSASPTPASVASAIAALEILQEQPELVNRLARNADRVRKGLTALGFNVIPGRTAIVPVIVGDDDKAFHLWKGLFDANIFVNVFISPATPPGKAMMRNSFMATHEDEHLDYIIDTYAKVGRQLGIID